jgi:hypothetical protein
VWKEEKDAKIEERTKNQGGTMDTENVDREWRARSEDILLGMKEWRRQHAKATLREIEEAITERLGLLGARMIQDTAQTSGGAQVTIERRYGTCPRCGVGLFPLDEGLGLLAGSLTPHQHES